jgi:hypothetical protein
LSQAQALASVELERRKAQGDGSLHNSFGGAMQQQASRRYEESFLVCNTINAKSISDLPLCFGPSFFTCKYCPSPLFMNTSGIKKRSVEANE